MAKSDDKEKLKAPEEDIPLAPFKVTVKNSRLDEVSKRRDDDKTEDERRAEENAELVKKVLGDEAVKPSQGIVRNFRRSKKEEAIMQAMENAERYNPDPDHGLTLEQVENRKTAGLVNVATRSNEKTYRSIFFQNIFTFFNLLCIVVGAALIAVESYKDLMFLAIMVINTTIGIVQECRSKKMIEKLSIISAPVAIVMRGGRRVTIPVDEIVLDDIMILENGKQICADSVLTKGKIEVNESMLTGESALVSKRDGDKLYAGSFVSSGNCYAHVEKVGNANYIESLTAFAKRYRKAGSELLNSLKKIIGIIGIIIVPIAILLFSSNYKTLGGDLSQTIPKTAGAIIGMIPAGMFLLTSIALAVCVIKLGKNHVLVQDSYCIEMLARTNVLCLDKTGTITDGTMRVTEVIPVRQTTAQSLDDVIGSMMTATGDNNQTALAVTNYFGYSSKLKPTVVMPFSSQRKLSAVTFEGIGTFIMGAPEFVLPEMDQKTAAIVSEKAKEGLRVIMIAHTVSEIRGERLPAGRKVLALICIEDHIREDAKETIQWFKNNDVAVKVISGDNPITVSEVARRVGIDHADKFVSLEGMSDQEVVEAANLYTVFGRVTPEQKRILVRAIKAKGNTVAMTGDGVNDILALKEADCSIAMATGSEAARNVSHMVLTDSNFSNMPTVVLEGRRVINNIQKSASLFLMKTLFSMILSVIVIILGMSYPVSPSSLMMIEMFIIGVPSFFLAFQTNTKRIEGHFFSNVLKESLPGGLALVCGYMALYIYQLNVPGLTIGSPQMQSMTVLIVNLIGWMMLLKMCQPLNLYRGLLCAGSLAMCATIIALSMLGENGFFHHTFGIAPIDLTNTLFVMVIVLASYGFATMIGSFVKAVKIN